MLYSQFTITRSFENGRRYKIHWDTRSEYTNPIYTYVTTWANRPNIKSLSPFVDRIIITDVGIGGSEWYSDGTRYRAVGGSVDLARVMTGGISTSTSTTALESVKLHGGLAKIGMSLH
jgi:hypothetical protein